MLIPLIELNEVEHYTYNGGLYPDITHAMVVNMKIEIPRLEVDKDGSIEIWYAKGYVKDNTFFEFPGYPGTKIDIDTTLILSVLPQYTTTGGSITYEVMRIASQVAIDQGIINGQIIDIGD